MKKQDTQEFDELQEHVANSYIGDYASVSQDLYKAIYYFHYLEAGEVPRTELQNISFALYRLAEIFHKVHTEERQHQYIKEVAEEMAHQPEGIRKPHL